MTQTKRRIKVSKRNGRNSKKTKHLSKANTRQDQVPCICSWFSSWGLLRIPTGNNWRHGLDKQSQGEQPRLNSKVVTGIHYFALFSGNDDILVAVATLFGWAVDAAAGVHHIAHQIPVRCVGRRYDCQVQGQLKELLYSLQDTTVITCLILWHLIHFDLCIFTEKKTITPPHKH